MPEKDWKEPGRVYQIEVLLLSVAFCTLGCKLNQIETEALSYAFSEAGFTVLPRIPAADESFPLLCIINTCTVTSKADQKARRIIRLCLNSGCIVIVTGCYAQLEQEALSALGKERGTLFVFPGRDKEKLLLLPSYLASNLKDSDFTSNIRLREIMENYSGSLNDPMHQRNPFSFNPRHFSFHSRAFLKIQDGCDFSCAYCRVPLARGKSISLESKEVLHRLKMLEEAGMAEAVLTGVNICQYRDPETPSRRLPELLEFLLENTKDIRLRLSSIEPEPYAVDSQIEILAHSRIRNHFHLSVQSGSDSVLAAMGRNYKAFDIVRITEKLKAIRNDPFIACDIITGFPGETEDDFKKTVFLCRTAGFASIHIFPFSKRPGTRAAAIKRDLVSERTARERLELLSEIARQGRNDYIRRWQGKTVEAVAESPFIMPALSVEKSDFFPFFPALTDNYIKVRVSVDQSCKRSAPGKAFCCRIGKAALENESGFDAWAELL